MCQTIINTAPADGLALLDARTSADTVVTNLYTVECRYNTVEYILRLPTALQWQQQSINQTLNSQKTPHIPPSQAIYGVFVVRIWEKIITVPHCIQDCYLEGQLVVACEMMWLRKWLQILRKIWLLNIFSCDPPWLFKTVWHIHHIMPALVQMFS